MNASARALSSSLLITLLLPSCIVRDTLRMESKLFVRIPVATPETRAKPVNDGWIFKPVSQGIGHVDEKGERKQVQGCWFMAYKKDEREAKKFPWFSQVNAWKRAKNEIPSLADAVFNRYGVYPQVVEPNRIYKPKVIDEAKGEPNRDEVAVLQTGAGSNRCWPAPDKFDPLWHHEVTGMNRAREAVERAGGHRSIRVGILDNGFDHTHAAFPRHIEKASQEAEAGQRHPGDAIGYLASSLGDHRSYAPERSRSDGHGTGTIGILAGSKATINDEKLRGSVGAVPDATIVPVRISPWVVSLATANFAYGIDYASRIQGCDVISMSHGGQPSLLWMDTINAAYDRGTVLVAAASNYMHFSLLNRGFIAPSTPVFPAACRRVLGVSGVTYSGKTYSRTDWHGFWHLLNPKNWFLMRGCSGPDGSWQSIRSTTPMAKRIDHPQVNRSGILRAQQISAPTPNVAWLAQPNGKTGANLVDINSGGTSSATPQVAGEIKARGKWHSWEKAETAIQAMLLSADRKDSTGNAPENQMPDSRHGLGAGVLRADEALRYDFDHMLHLKGSTLKFPENGRRAPRDMFDASKSLQNMVFSSDTRHKEDFINRAAPRLNQPLFAKNDREKALTDLYFNLGILEQWKEGHLPLSKQGETNYRENKPNMLNPMKSRFLWFFKKHESNITKDAEKAAGEAMKAQATKS